VRGVSDLARPPRSRLDPKPTTRTTTRRITSTIGEGNPSLFKTLQSCSLSCSCSCSMFEGRQAKKRQKDEDENEHEHDRGGESSSLQTLQSCSLSCSCSIFEGRQAKRGRKTRTSARRAVQSSIQARTRPASARMPMILRLGKVPFRTGAGKARIWSSCAR
jgi:hypothetical protein